MQVIDESGAAFRLFRAWSNGDVDVTFTQLGGMTGSDEPGTGPDNSLPS